MAWSRAIGISFSRYAAVISLSSWVLACGGAPPAKAPEPALVSEAPPPVTKRKVEATVAPNPNTAVNLSDDILRACAIVDNSERAPRFDFDSNDLSAEEKNILEQVAKCLTVGALKGRAVRLVGRADARGESEYNMTLGAKRADTVKGYLSGLGVDKAKMAETSRGELDASGTDEASWNKDRRVDVDLMK